MKNSDLQFVIWIESHNENGKKIKSEIFCGKNRYDVLNLFEKCGWIVSHTMPYQIKKKKMFCIVEQIETLKKYYTITDNVQYEPLLCIQRQDFYLI